MYVTYLIGIDTANVVAGGRFELCSTYAVLVPAETTDPHLLTAMHRWFAGLGLNCLSTVLTPRRNDERRPRLLSACRPWSHGHLWPYGLSARFLGCLEALKGPRAASGTSWNSGEFDRRWPQERKPIDVAIRCIGLQMVSGRDSEQCDDRRIGKPSSHPVVAGACYLLIYQTCA